MATAVVMPKLGNTVESCLLVAWKKAVGDAITEGEPLCEVETDKATLDVESTASGTVLALFFQEGDDIPVLTNIAVVGAPGEDVETFRPDQSGLVPAPAEPSPAAAELDSAAERAQPQGEPNQAGTGADTRISPRARHLAERKSLDVAAIPGTGPGGRIIERDVQAALKSQRGMTPLAKRMVEAGDYQAPPSEASAGRRVTAHDLLPVAPSPASAAMPEAGEDETETITLRGPRKIIAERMLASLQTTAQLTLNSSADARALLAYRQRLKTSAEELGLQQVTINDLVLFAVSRTLPHYPELNALFHGDAVTRFKNVHLAMAVDTPRGLIVPVIRNAHRLSLRDLAAQARSLASACLDGSVNPDSLQGGTFTVTNLGSLGIESFTPILNAPQVGILGVSNINLKPVQVGADVEFIPHLGLSLTINHQVVDGAPGARFLHALAQNIGNLELLLAM